jgi:putative Holliday junction resolvase
LQGLYFWVQVSPVKALGLDVGQKTIGLAVTDDANIAAHPVGTIARAGTDADVSEIQTLVRAREITDLVVGMPFELSGKIGHRARRVQAFMRILRERLPASLNFHEQDERFTTAEATRVLLDADLSRAKRKAVIDAQAAALILTGWLAGWHAHPKSGI